MKQNHFIKKLAAVTAAFSLLLTLIPTQPAQAAFPGVNGQVAWVSAGRDSIHHANIDGSGEQALITSTGFGVFAPRYSADGEKVTYSQLSQAPDSLRGSDIYIANSNGNDPQLIVGHDSSKQDNGVVFSSFFPNGNQLVYSDIWDEEESGDPVGQIMQVNADGTSKTPLTSVVSGRRDMYPVVSPDGSKVAFWRDDVNIGTGGIWLMNADGSEQEELVVLTERSGFLPETNESLLFAGHMVGDVTESPTAFDWSPDGSKLVYVERSGSLGSQLTTWLRTVDLSGSVQTLRQAVLAEDFTGSMIQNTPQYAPDGSIIFQSGGFDFAQGTASSSLYLLNLTDDSTSTIISVSFGVEEAENNMSLHSFPTIQPLQSSPETPNQTVLPNAEDSKSILLQTPEGTELTCSSALKESTQTKQDGSYDYPLGLMEFCFDTEAENNTVTLTFVTDLKPNQVVARKYNTTNSTYFDIQGATITETQYNGQHALNLTYTIEDNGTLDLDPETGKIKDPVGLAVAEGGLAETGEDVSVITLTALLTIVGSGVYLSRRLRFA